MTEKKFPIPRAELVTPASALNLLTDMMRNPHPPTALRICVIPADSVMGPSPTTGVRAIVEGFDWDHGTVLISPEQPLTVLSAEQVQDIQKSMRQGSNWHTYRRHERMQLKIDALSKALEDELCSDANGNISTDKDVIARAKAAVRIVIKGADREWRERNPDLKLD